MPLSLDSLILLSESRNKMEASLGLTLSNFELNAPPAFLEEFDFMIKNYLIEKVKENPENYSWYTNWIIVESDTNLTVGGIGTRGITDEEGENMIGYFIDKKSEGKGYATEAVVGFTAWIFKASPILKTIWADTLTDGLASQLVLKKAGFIFDSNVEEGLRWRLDRR